MDQKTRRRHADAEDELVARYVEERPHRPGPSNAWLARWGIPVWAIVGHYRAVGRDPVRVASDYDVPQEAVAAALVFYRRNASAIDARLADHEAAFA